jgi:hypothetical protein
MVTDSVSVELGGNKVKEKKVTCNLKEAYTKSKETRHCNEILQFSELRASDELQLQLMVYTYYVCVKLIRTIN